MTTCKYCNTEIGDIGELCQGCSNALGLTPGSGVRRMGPCEKCQHPELIRALVRELTVDALRDVPRAVTMAVSYVPVAGTSFWTGRTMGLQGVDEMRPIGILEMYVCMKCGFTEWYCREPQSIPIGETYGTEKIDATSAGPYR